MYDIVEQAHTGSADHFEMRESHKVHINANHDGWQHHVVLSDARSCVSPVIGPGLDASPIISSWFDKPVSAG